MKPIGRTLGGMVGFNDMIPKVVTDATTVSPVTEEHPLDAALRHLKNEMRLKKVADTPEFDIIRKAYASLSAAREHTAAQSSMARRDVENKEGRAILDRLGVNPK